MPFDGAFSPIHWLIVAVVILLVLGPDKLPNAAPTAAKGRRDLQQVRGTLAGQLRDITDEVVPSELGAPVPVAAPPDTRPARSEESSLELRYGLHDGGDDEQKPERPAE
jgi:TatA/E family protein of Tat protein translocase